MSVEIPEDLQNLEANSGIFAIWMIFHHYGIDLNISDLTQLCQHDLEMGSSSIALAVALKTLGLDVDFYTEHDSDKQPVEVEFYQKAQAKSNYLFMNLLFHMQKFRKGGARSFCDCVL